MNTDATVSVGIVGDEVLVAAAAKIGEAWRAAGQKISNSAKEFGRDMQNAFRSTVSDAVGVATAASRINFAAGAASARDLGLSITRAAVSSGRDVEALRGQMEKISKGSLMSDAHALALSESLRAVTYDARFATDSIQGIADEAEALGQSPQQVTRFAESLRNVEGVTTDLAKSMDEVDSIAHRIGIDPRQLHDQIIAADGVLSRFKGNARETAALLANLGKGLSPGQQAGTQQAILGAITGDRVGYERLLRGQGGLKHGETILNERGEIDDQIGTIEKVQSALIKKFGKKRALQVARMTYGDIEGSALMAFDARKARDDARNEGGDFVGPVAPAGIQARIVRESEQARQVAIEIERHRNEQKAGGKIAESTSWLGELIAEHPVLGGIFGAGATAAAPKAATYLAGKVGLGAAPSASLALTAAGPFVAPFVTDSLGKGVAAAAQRDVDDLASGRKRRVDHWYGKSLEDVPEAQQATAAAVYADQLARALSNVTLNATVQQLADGTIKGVTLGKASAGQQ